VPGAVFTAQRQPHPELIPGLTVCDAGLCFLGIIPGQGSIHETIARLLNTYHYTALDSYNFMSPDSLDSTKPAIPRAAFYPVRN
jgi:hypothetical protein